MTLATPAERRRALTALEREGYGHALAPIDHEAVHPVTGIEWEIRRTVANIEALQGKLLSLPQEQLVFGTSQVTTTRTLTTVDGNAYTNLEGLLNDGQFGSPEIMQEMTTEVVETARIHAWVEMYMKERQHYVQLQKLVLNAHFKDRKQNLAESNSTYTNAAIKAVVQALGHDVMDLGVRQLIRAALLEALTSADPSTG